MWIKKSEFKIEEERRVALDLIKKNRIRNSLKTSVWAFIIVFFGSMLYSVTIGFGDIDEPAPSDILKLKEIPEYLDYFLFLATGFAILAFLYRFFRNSAFGVSKLSSSTVICDTCFKAKNFDNENKCSCGGYFLPIDNFEWQEDTAKNSYKNS